MLLKRKILLQSWFWRAVVQWSSAWLETEGPRVWASLASLRCGLWARNIYPSLVLVQPRKTRACLTERLLMGRQESNQTKSNKKSILIPLLIIFISNKLPFWYAWDLRPHWVNHQNMFQSNSPLTKLWKLAFSTPAPNVSSLSLVPFRPWVQYYFFKE